MAAEAAASVVPPSVAEGAAFPGTLGALWYQRRLPCKEHNLKDELVRVIAKYNDAGVMKVKALREDAKNKKRKAACILITTCLPAYSPVLMATKAVTIATAEAPLSLVWRSLVLFPSLMLSIMEDLAGAALPGTCTRLVARLAASASMPSPHLIGLSGLLILPRIQSLLVISRRRLNTNA